MKRIREVLESIAYTGLKPSGGLAAPPKNQLRWLGPLQGPVDKFLSGGPAPNDPLYLTNRTIAQKAKAWSLVGIPILVLAAGIGATLYILEPHEAKPIAQPTAAEISAKLLPNLAKDYKIPAANDLQVAEITVSSTRVSGILQNTGKREIPSAELVLDLTNAAGSQLGAVSITVEKIPALGRREFSHNIKQRDATYALIRELTAR